MNLADVRIIAHRGNSAALPENTMAAFRSAVTIGAHMIELDVRLSRDSEPVAIHDEDVARTTTSHGLVSQFPVDQLRRLSIPTLQDVLALAIAVNLEIKDDAAIPSILDMIEGRQDVLMSSFDIDSLDFLRQLAPRLPIAYLSREDDCRAVLERAGAAGAYAFNPAAAAVTPELVALAHDARLRIMPFTVNDPAEGRRLFAWGVDAIFTDNPASMLAIL
jgi:glycerophosphoryl diester phosphodiesterase